MAVPKRKLVLWILCVVNICSFMFFAGIHGDVPDDVVYTELHKDVRIGDRAVLTCRFRGLPLAVYWKKGYDPRRSPNLVSWIPTDDVNGKCHFHRVCEIMEMNKNYSLIIKDVGISEQGRYICRVSNYKGNIIHNFTDISLYATPTEPYPVIDGCINNGSSVSNPDHCRVQTSKTVTLTCSVTNYFPEIELFFLHGTKQMTTINQKEQTNVDSTKDMSISIEAGPSETLYTCVASNVPGSRERKAASVLVESYISIPSETIPVTLETMKGRSPVTRAVMIVIPVVLLGAAVVFIWLKWTHRNTHTGEIQDHADDNPERTPMLSDHADDNPERTPMLSDHADDNPERTPMLSGVNRCVTAHSSVKVETTSVTYELAKDTFTSSRNVDISDLQSVFKTQDKETNQAQPDLTTNLEVAEQGEFSNIIKKLDLGKYYPSKISLTDAMLIRKFTEDLKLIDLPWQLISKVLMIDFHARDQLLSHANKSLRKEKPDDGSVFDLEALLEMRNTSGSEDSETHLNPMDVLVAVFTCCDNFLKQTLAQKLFICKLAIPFLYPLGPKGKIGMSVWALRTITVQRHTKQNVISETSVTEEYFPLVTFVRLGRAPLSKSKLINDILRDDGHDTFFHKDCINGTIPRRISDGLVECSWFITIGERKDHLPDTTMVLNLRGDASLMKKQMQILKEISSVIFVTASDQDLAKPQNTNTFREILQTNAKIILLLICGKHEQGTLACFGAIGKEFLKNVSIILSRTRKGIEKNASELKSDSREKLTETISGCPGTVVKDFARRARELGIIIDEYDKACLEGKDLAEKIVSQLKGKEIIDCKRLLLPLQGAEWTEYCKLLKMHHRTSGQGSQSTSSNHVHVVKQKMDRLREKQVDICRNRLTPFIKDFMSNLQKNFDVVRYFLKWMDLLLNEISKANLSELHRQYNTTWRKFQEAKMQQKNTEVQHLISQVNDAENRLASASLGLENLFREIGQIYEAVKGDCKVGKDTWADVEYLPEIAAKLLLNGIPFQLVDGDTSVIPIVWVSAVLSQLGNIIGKKRLFVLSILGIQGSGKSTLLNTMFGLQFAVSAERCTRGAYMQLIPVDGNADLPFDYVAVVDTEGLRAPELMQLSYEHDNELATLVIGLGDVTMINIKRENTDQMKDIMQIAVHAFLRMDLARRHRDIRDPQTCLFLHQNTPAARAEDVMMHVKENLDNMTKEAALCENIKSIQLFSQIINFDIRKHVCFFSDLWYGNPPMARANSAYSENVGALRSNMLADIAKTQRTFLTSAGLSSRLASLWNRILDDDFVFRFRNSLEVKAYNCLKSKYYTLEWQLQNKLKSWLPTAERKMKICDTIECLEKTHKSFLVGLDKVLRGKAEEIQTTLIDYFKRNNLQGIVKQWQQSELKQLTCAVEQQQKEGRTYLLSIKEARQVELVQTQKWSKHQADILNKAVELADKLEGEEATVEVEKAFDTMWMSMVRDLATTTDEKLKMDVVIEGILHKRFHAHRAILRDELKRHPLKNPLQETSLESSITADDERKEHITLKGLTIMKRTNIQADAINIQSQARHKIMEETGKILKEISKYLEFSSTQDVKLNSIYATEVLNILLDKLYIYNQDINETNVWYSTIHPEYVIKLAVYVSCHCVQVFKSMELEYNKKHGMKAMLQDYRNTGYNLFKNTYCETKQKIKQKS